MTTVTDSSFPLSISITGTPTGAGWSCSNSIRGFSCTRFDSIRSGVSFPPITVPANISGNAAPNSTLINTAAVSNPGDATPGDNTDAAHIIIIPPPAGFDLSIKKFVNGQDAQSVTSATSVSQNSQATYTFVVRNNGTAAVSGVTTVSDNSFNSTVFPAGVPTGSGWSCTL